MLGRDKGGRPWLFAFKDCRQSALPICSRCQTTNFQLTARSAELPTTRTAGVPCRVSLTDAKAGDELILVNHEHHPVDSPYRMRFAIYVRKGEETYDKVDQIPEQLRKRTLALRSFDADGMMVQWELVEGRDLEAAIERQLANPRAGYLHIHFAAPGCYAARVERS